MVEILGGKRATATGSKIAGGFVLVSVEALMAVWRASKCADLRTWLVSHEMTARRCMVAAKDRPPTYTIKELSGLLGVTEKRAWASVKRLVKAGRLEWSSSAVVFPEPADPGESFIDDTISRGRGQVAIPRRLLRFLARGARPTLIATALGVLFRCLSRRKGEFDGWGRVKVSWIARAFAVDSRRVKAARKELVDLGWITPEASHQWVENRWGRAFRINLGWQEPGSDGRSLPPPPPADRLVIATPCSDQEPLFENEENQKPASGGPTGVALKGSGPAGGNPDTLPAPTLDNVRLEDLKETGRLLELHRQAAALGQVGTSEADRLKFVGAAEHARAVGQSNIPGLFRYLVRAGAWRFITQADEDSARRRLQDHFYVPRRPPHRKVIPDSPGLSEDARLVRAVRAAVIRAGIYRDPWADFRSKAAGWDRARWDLAMNELGLA